MPPTDEERQHWHDNTSRDPSKHPDQEKVVEKKPARRTQDEAPPAPRLPDPPPVPVTPAPTTPPTKGKPTP